MSQLLVLLVLTASPGLFAFAVWSIGKRRGWSLRRLESALAVSWLLLLFPAYWTMTHDVPQRLWWPSSFFASLFTLVAVMGVSYTGLFVVLYLVDRQLRQTEWTMAQGVAYQLRGVALSYVPLAALIGTSALVMWATQHFGLPNSAIIILSWGMGPLVLLVVFLFYPQIFALFMKGRPLSSSLGESLQELVNRSGIRVAGFMIVPGRSGKIANAWVAGTVPWNRWIFMTDTLLDQFSAAELLAVVGHELGHLHYRHLLKNALVAVCSTFLWGLSYQALSRVIPLSIGVVLITGIILATVWSALTGLVSRRAELEADAYAVDLVGDPEALASALLKLRRLGRDSDDGLQNTEWMRIFRTHPTITERVQAIRGRGCCP